MTSRPPVRLKPLHVGVAVGVLAVLVLVIAAGRSCRSAAPAGPGEEGAGAAPTELPTPATGDVPTRPVTLFWPSREEPALVPTEVPLEAAGSPVDQARRVVELLLGEPPSPHLARPFPEGTALRGIFVDDARVAYVSLSQEVASKAPGGSAWESLAVHALAGSLDRAVPEVDRVQILVEGQEIETLNGHLDLRSPVRFDPSLVASGGGASPATR